jgi:hypothetical protein
LEDETSIKKSETEETAATEDNGVDAAAETTVDADQQAAEMEETETEAVNQRDSSEAQDNRDAAPGQQTASVDADHSAEDTPEMPETDSVDGTGDGKDNTETNTEDRSTTA